MEAQERRQLLVALIRSRGWQEVIVPEFDARVKLLIKELVQAGANDPGDADRKAEIKALTRVLNYEGIAASMLVAAREEAQDTASGLPTYGD